MLKEKRRASRPGVSARRPRADASGSFLSHEPNCHPDGRRDLGGRLARECSGAKRIKRVESARRPDAPRPLGYRADSQRLTPNAQRRGDFGLLFIRSGVRINPAFHFLSTLLTVRAIGDPAFFRIFQIAGLTPSGPSDAIHCGIPLARNPAKNPPMGIGSHAAIRLSPVN